EGSGGEQVIQAYSETLKVLIVARPRLMPETLYPPPPQRWGAVALSNTGHLWLGATDSCTLSAAGVT
ncbi:unnamed protein product, partial [Chrysoparadoxa australica]